jgi:tetratricopeptide (TPR) repeat protein
LQSVLDALFGVLALPHPPSFLAFGELSDDGRIQPMPEVDVVRKALLQRASSLPVMVLVSPELAVAFRGDPEIPARCVLGVTDFSEALLGMGLAEQAREGALWAENLDVGWTVERLFTLALESSSVPCGWPVLGALAVGLLRRLREPVLRWKAAFVRDVARRHGGEPARIDGLTDDLLEAFPVEIRLRLLAHMLQSAADGDPGKIPEYAEVCRQELEHRTASLSPGRAVLHGALGRALAAVGRYEDALLPLRQAMEDWQRLDPASASYPLCELLRLLGILGRRDSLDDLESRVRPFLEQRPSTVSASFVALAWGRALEQVGDHAAAAAILDQETFFQTAPEHVRTARLRWLASAQRHQGKATEAATILSKLEALGDTDQLHLARRDQARAQGASEAELEAIALALLESSGGDEAKNTLASLAPGLEVRWAVRRLDLLDRLCKEYRY